MKWILKAALAALVVGTAESLASELGEIWGKEIRRHLKQKRKTRKHRKAGRE